MLGLVGNVRPAVMLFAAAVIAAVIAVLLFAAAMAVIVAEPAVPH